MKVAGDRPWMAAPLDAVHIGGEGVDDPDIELGPGQDDLNVPRDIPGGPGDVVGAAQVPGFPAVGRSHPDIRGIGRRNQTEQDQNRSRSISNAFHLLTLFPFRKIDLLEETPYPHEVPMARPFTTSFPGKLPHLRLGDQHPREIIRDRVSGKIQMFWLDSAWWWR